MFVEASQSVRHSYPRVCSTRLGNESCSFSTLHRTKVSKISRRFLACRYAATPSYSWEQKPEFKLNIPVILISSARFVRINKSLLKLKTTDKRKSSLVAVWRDKTRAASFSADTRGYRFSLHLRARTTAPAVMCPEFEKKKKKKSKSVSVEQLLALPDKKLSGLWVWNWSVRQAVWIKHSDIRGTLCHLWRFSQKQHR